MTTNAFDQLHRALPGDPHFRPGTPWYRLAPAGVGATWRVGFMDDHGTLWFRSPSNGLWNTARKTWPTVPGPL